MLNLCGIVGDKNTEKEVKAEIGWSQIIEYGFINRENVKNVLNRSFAGIVTLHPIINYLDALPVKMFEYMSAGIPVIASNFPLWRDIIEGNNCGICVDPLNPNKIAEAIDYLFMHPEQAEIMGNNGRIAVEQKYNWETEKEKLVGFYKVL
jgi:glycosyltransferase involved in cell wall biosynthesis